MPQDQVITFELAQFLLELSENIGRQIGLLLSRRGNIDFVIVGERNRIFLPDFGRLRTGAGRFRGLRLIHTHLKGENITRDDLTDLALLRLDLVGVIGNHPGGVIIYLAHLMPPDSKEGFWNIIGPTPLSKLKLNFYEFITSLEQEFAKKDKLRRLKEREDRAVLVHVSEYRDSTDAEDSLDELKELVKSAGLEVVDAVLQIRDRIDPKYVLGRGKLEDIVVRCLQYGADFLIFDHELTSVQARSIAEITDLKVLDRTQVILDIFAQRAQSLDGKIQVELAQLKHRLSRLGHKDDALSRLTGGIGGRGPGETKLEIGRRRIYARIAHLEAKLKKLSKRRMLRRMVRAKSKIPLVAIIGYTNAGKSTLLNTLTSSDVYTAPELFATLDPRTRRLYLPSQNPNERLEYVLITDTVGFIRHLPKELISAFRATLEELNQASLFLHLVDTPHKRFQDQIEAVEDILARLNLLNIPRILVLNKKDLLAEEELIRLEAKYHAIAISALKGQGIERLLQNIKIRLFNKD